MAEVEVKEEGQAGPSGLAGHDYEALRPSPYNSRRHGQELEG